MMRDIVFVDLNHRPPRPLLVLQACLAAYAGNLGIVGTGGDESIEGIFSHIGIGVDHQEVFV